MVCFSVHGRSSPSAPERSLARIQCLSCNKERGRDADAGLFYLNLGQAMIPATPPPAGCVVRRYKHLHDRGDRVWTTSCDAMIAVGGAFLICHASVP